MKKLLAYLLVIPFLLVSFPVDAAKKHTKHLTTHEQVLKKIREKELHCLAKNLYFEAGNQGNMGQAAVAFVTLNRVKNSNYPPTICEVVYQKSPDEVCQFSWVCGYEDKGLDRTINPTLYANSIRIARHVIAIHGKPKTKDPTHGALFFHAVYVEPDWSTYHRRTVKIGDHIFYAPRKV